MPRAATQVWIKIMLAFVVSATLAACSNDDAGSTSGTDVAGGGAAGGGVASCLASITFEGRAYVGVQVAKLPVGDQAGEGVTPPCNDTGTTDEQPSAPFPVLKIDGIDPSVAVATEAEAAGGYWVWFTGDDPFSGKVPAAVQKVIDGSS